MNMIIQQILPLNEISKKDIVLAGGKAASLGELMKIGTSVPQGFAITTDCYKQFWNQEFSRDVSEEILNAFDNLKTERVAVRSSAVAEDSSSASWAGQLDTFLNIKREDLIKAIRKCWESIRAQRALAYATQLDIKEGDLTVGVIVQKMVESIASGVIFTINPVNKKHNKVMIEAGYGLGELLVQGSFTPDNFLVDKDNLKIIDSCVSSKKTMLVFKNGKNKKIPVPKNKREKAAISSEQILQLTKIGMDIEKHYATPQDIEWAIDSDGKIWILQSRPITSI